MKKIIIEDGLNLYKKTGQGKYTQNLYNILCEMGCDVEMRRKSFLEKIKNSTIKRFLYILWINTIFPFHIIFKDTNIIIFTNTLTPLFKLPGKQYFPVLHDLWAYKSPQTMSILQRCYMKFVMFSINNTYKKIITVSNTVKKEIVDFYKCNEDDVKVIYNTFSFGEHPEISYTNEEQQRILSEFDIESKKYILSVATLNKRKNIPMLIDAYNKLDNQDVKLVLVGGASTEHFKDVHNGNIIFTGYIGDEILKVLYKNALLYVFPSVYEGFGIPIIDAQAFGVPVICSDISVFHEIGDNSVYYTKLTHDDLKDNLQNLLKNLPLQKILISNGYNNIQKFIDNNIKQLIVEALNL